MKKGITRLGTSFLSTLLVASLLTGCGKKDGTNKEEKNTEATEQTTELQAENTAEATETNTTPSDDANDASKAHNAYEAFLEDKETLSTDPSFAKDDDDYNIDCVHHGTYTISELKAAIETSYSNETYIQYAYMDLGLNNTEDLLIRFQSKDSSFTNWIGTVCYEDGELYLRDYYEDGYRTTSTLYDTNYLIIGGSSGAGAYGSTINSFSADGKISTIFTENEYYGTFAESVIYDLQEEGNYTGVSGDYSDIAACSNMLVREYVANNTVQINVSNQSEDASVKAREDELIKEFTDAGAIIVDTAEMDKLVDTKPYEGNEIAWTTLDPKEALGNNNPSDSDVIINNTDEPIFAYYATEEDIYANDYTTELIADDSEYATNVMFSFGEAVSEVTFYNISWCEYREDGLVDYNAEVIDNKGSFSANDKLLVVMAFIGDTANMGVSFVDSSGKYHSYAIEQSGFDGSVILTECILSMG